MFARRGDTIGGDIVTGDWSDNGKWDSAVDIRCKVAPNVQCGNVHAAAIHHNVPSGVVDGDSGGGNLPPPICKPVSNLRCSISQCQSHLVSIIGFLCLEKLNRQFSTLHRSINGQCLYLMRDTFPSNPSAETTAGFDYGGTFYP